VLAEHNVEWQSFSRLADEQRNPLVRMALRRDSRRTAVWEANALGRFEHTLVLSELDRQLLLEARPDLNERISVWPLPIDPGQLSALDDGGQPLTVLVLGSLRAMGRVHGLRWFLRDVWPEVRDRVPDARLEIVGADPPPDIVDQDSRDGVTVHGFVDDLDPILNRVDICAIPLFVGAGIRVKVFELISRGIPCLGTSVALQGVDWIEGCVEVGGREEWIARLSAAANNRHPLRKAAARGAVSLQDRHSRQRATDHLRKMIEAIV
jgi:glycosyltransferase involved in cell wall biosynthesis